MTRKLYVNKEAVDFVVSELEKSDTGLSRAELLARCTFTNEVVWNAIRHARAEGRVHVVGLAASGGSVGSKYIYGRPSLEPLTSKPVKRPVDRDSRWVMHAAFMTIRNVLLTAPEKGMTFDEISTHTGYRMNPTVYRAMRTAYDRDLVNTVGQSSVTGGLRGAYWALTELGRNFGTATEGQ